MKEVILEGHTVYLRLPTEADIINSDWHMWYNDYETTKFNSHGVFPISREQELEFLRKSLSDHNLIHFAIVTKAGDNLIGNIALQDIDLLHRKANLSITIGEADYRGRTCALEAMGLILDHGFSRLNLNRIYGATHEGLLRVVEMLKIFGCKREGLRREDFYRDGRFYDMVCYSVLARDFFKIKSERGGKVLFNNLSDLVRAVADDNFKCKL